MVAIFLSKRIFELFSFLYTNFLFDKQFLLIVMVIINLSNKLHFRLVYQHNKSPRMLVELIMLLILGYFLNYSSAIPCFLLEWWKCFQSILSKDLNAFIYTYNMVKRHNGGITITMNSKPMKILWNNSL